MKEIIDQWINKRLGLIVNINNLGPLMKDGTLIVNILKHYEGINPNCIDIKKSNDKEDCRINLIQLKVWLRYFNINFSNNDIDDILNEKQSTCFMILYKLYVAFENNKFLYFKTKQAERYLQRSNKRFTINDISLTDVTYGQATDEGKNVFKHSDRFLENKNIVSWYIKKHEAVKNISLTKPLPEKPVIKNKKVRFYKNDGVVKKSFDDDVNFVRNKLDYSSCELSNISNDFHSCDHCTNPDFFKGIYEISHNNHSFLNDNFKTYTNKNKDVFLPKIVTNSKNVSVIDYPYSLENINSYLTKLKSEVLNSFNKKFTSVYPLDILQDPWNYILDKEENQLDEMITNSLFKQAVFEKKLMMKFYQIKHQSQVQNESYSILEKRLNIVNDNNNNNIHNECSAKKEDDTLKIKLMYNDYVLYFNNERKRTVELHRKLYAEKLKLRFDKHYALCLETLLDYIDICIIKSEFKAYYEQPITKRIWAQWVCLFQNGIPTIKENGEILNLTLNVNNDDVINDNANLILDEKDLSDYIDITSEWKSIIKNLSNDEENNLLYDPGNLFVIGHIVHRLLETKYPYQPHPPPAQIPKYPVRVILNGLNDDNVIFKLKLLLEKSQILLIDVNSAVNFCINCFKDDCDVELIHLLILEFSKSSGKSVRESLNQLSDDTQNVKSTQTSLSSVNEEDSYTLGNAIQCGEELFNLMLSGHEIPNTLIVNAIIEYIKSFIHKNIRGWVLIDFPSTLLQASVLEYALSSKKFPFDINNNDDDILYESDPLVSKETKDNTNNTNILEFEVRSSRIVPNPRNSDEEILFSTYFSKHLSLIKGEFVLHSNSIPSKEDHSNSSVLLEHPEKEGVPTIQEFYMDQNISYDFIYESFDLPTLKQLARLILEQLNYESSLHKMSLDLFGEDVLNELYEMELSKNIGSKKFTEEDSSTINDVKKFVINMNNNSELISNEEEESSVVYNEDVEVEFPKSSPKPGEKDWVYSSEPIIKKVEKSLVMIWETLETMYLNDLKYIFNIKRVSDHYLIPYMYNVNKTLQHCLAQKDDRQEIVDEFLNRYNGLHKALRSDDEMQIELHLQVNELKETLSLLFEKKRHSIEEICKSIITQNWAFMQMSVIGNCFLQMLQIEKNRCERSLNLIKDYYFAMLKNYKPDSIQIDNVDLSKLDVTGGSKHQYLASEIIYRMFNYDYISTTENPIYKFINDKGKTLTSAIQKCKLIYEALIKSKETEALRMHKDNFDKKVSELKDLENKLTTKNRKSKISINITPVDDDFLLQPQKLMEEAIDKFKINEENIKNMFLEWKSALNEEIDRVLLTIIMIIKKAYFDIKEIEEKLSLLFKNFNDSILQRFSNECDHIKTLGSLFCFAIKEKIPINAEIIFDNEQLVINKKLSEEILPKVNLPLPIEEMVDDYTFTIKQLQEITELLTFIAPDGNTNYEIFASFFEEIIISGSKKESCILVPVSWNKLNREDLRAVFRKIYGSCSVIEWKEFFIYALDFPYPILEDVFDAQLQFLKFDPLLTETVTYEDYMNTNLWFHREIPETPAQALRNVLGKEFLFTLFKSKNSNLINYTAFLLSFCKDELKITGFSRALTLFYGRGVIIFETDTFITKIFTDNIDTSRKIIDGILEELIDSVVKVGCLVNRPLDEFMSDELRRLEDLFLSFNQFSSISAVELDKMESIYYQLIRLAYIPQWSSDMPLCLIFTLLSLSFQHLCIPEYIVTDFLLCFDEIRILFMKLQEEGKNLIHLPAFMENKWMKFILTYFYKFKVVYLKDIVMEIISDK